jgi:ankyrin repeat domain-containing protein 50
MQATTIHSIIYRLISTRSLTVYHVHEAIQGKKAAIAYIYCDYNNPKTQSKLELLSNIACQLTEQTSSMPLAVKEFCDKNAKKRRNPTGDEWISLIKSICLLFQKTYVFVDALVIFFIQLTSLTSSRVTN